MIAYPLDSHVNFNSDGIPEFDRAITSAPFRKLIRQLVREGIDPTVSTSLQVYATGEMTVTVNPGFGVVDGLLALEEELRTLVVTASDGTYDRIDTVVLRLNDNDNVRLCDLYIVQGVPSSSPVHPDLTREGSIYELGLADIFVGAHATRITIDKITDTRYDTERCGVISPIAEFDTETLNQQMTAWAQAQQEEFGEWEVAQKASFEAWVQTIQNILDESAAGHLQLEIERVDKARMGLEETHIEFNDDGSITETKGDGRTLETTFNADGTITQVLEDALGGELWRQTTTFNADGSIDVVKEVE